MSFFAAANCPSVCLSVRLSQPLRSRFVTETWYFIRWLETPTACGSQIPKVIWQISRSHRQQNLVKRVTFRVFGTVTWYWYMMCLFDFLILVAFWLNETFPMCGFRIWWRTHDSNGLKFGMPMYPDYPQNCLYLVTVCWFSSFLTLQQVPVSKALSWHYNDVIMSSMVSQITGTSIVYSTVCSDADQRKHQSSTSLAFVRAIHRWIPRTKGQ